MPKYFQSQTLFPTEEKRKEAREFIRRKYGRSFSEQVQRYILRDMNAERDQKKDLDALNPKRKPKGVQ